MDQLRSRVLQITLRADRSGGPRYTSALCAGVRDSFEIFLALPRRDDMSSEMVKAVGSDRIIYLPRRRFDIFSLIQMLYFIRTHRIDLLHSHGRGAGLYARIAGLLAGVPVVHTFHGVHRKRSLVLRTAIFAAERLLRRATSVFVCLCDGEAKEAVRERLAHRHRLIVIKSGVKVIASRSDPPMQPKILHFSRFDEQKNFSEFLEIASRLQACLPEVAFEVIGDGVDRPYWMERAACLGLNMSFSGSVANPEEALLAATALISTSRWEGLPMVLMEAMQCGVPVLASDVTGNNDLIKDGETGRLYSLGDIEAAVCAYRDLSSNGAKYAEAAIRNIEKRYSYRRMISAHRHLYRLLGERVNASPRGARVPRPVGALGLIGERPSNVPELP